MYLFNSFALTLHLFVYISYYSSLTTSQLIIVCCFMLRIFVWLCL
jgi:hypothetical protein